MHSAETYTFYYYLSSRTGENKTKTIQLLRRERGSWNCIIQTELNYSFFLRKQSWDKKKNIWNNVGAQEWDVKCQWWPISVTTPVEISQNAILDGTVSFSEQKIWKVVVIIMSDSFYLIWDSELRFKRIWIFQ